MLTEPSAPRRNTKAPLKGIWKRFLLLIPLALVLAVASYAYVRSACDTYVAAGYAVFGEEVVLSPADVSLSTDGVVEVVSVEKTQTGSARVEFHALADGEVEASVGTQAAQDVWFLEVRNGAIIEGGLNFSGWQAIHASVCIFLAAIVILFASVLVRLQRLYWYGYEMIACFGGLIFCLFELAFFMALMCMSSLRGFGDLVFELKSGAEAFALVSLVPMTLVALLVMASNISLIRHEGLRPVNLLGIIVGVLWALTNALWFGSTDFMYRTFYSYMAADIVYTLVAAAITYGECLLLATVICAWLATRRTPRRAVDYLVILGCGIRADGTPSPLLAGRVDKALAFDAACVSEGEAPATFVPSGGQGPNEPISEAQSMGTYLEGHGIAPERIVLEDRSATTRQNMAYSRTVIERHAGRDASELRVGFSTTNYHVFRGYVCGHQAGMAVEGMGSKTRAYFWPNAFLREFAGLVVGEWKLIVLVYLALAVVYGFAAYALMVV